MKHLFSILGVTAGLTLSSLANASVTTYTFATSNEQLSNGATYCATYSTSCGSVPTVGVYADQTSGSLGTFVSTPANAGSPTYQSTESGLFTVTDDPNNRGAGIAPYDPSEGTGGSFDNQDGIVDNVPGSSNNGNILLLKLSDISANSTLSLLLQAGVSGDSFTIYTFDDSGAAPTSLNQMKDVGTYNVDEDGTSTPNGTSPGQGDQVTGLTIAGLSSSTTGWIAIQADCHYLLLNSLSINSPAATPEPRFYSMLLAAFLGLAGVVYQKRRTAQANA
jgi:hypothetical protein